MGLLDYFGVATKRDVGELEIKLSDKDGEIKKLNNELGNALTNLSGYQSALYGWLNNGQPVQLADNAFSYIQDGYFWNADVFACVDLILSKLAQCVPVLYEVNKADLGQVQKYRNLLQSNTDSSRVQAKAIEIKALKQISSHPINELLYTPNKLQTYSDWIKAFGGFYLLTGNSYNYYNALIPSKKQWKEMYVLPSQFIQIISGGEFNPVKGYRIINQRFFGSDMYDFEAANVSHLKTFNPNYTNYGSQLYGQSPLSASRLTIAKNRDTRIEANKQAKNGGAMGILSPLAGSPALNAEQARDLREQVASKHRSSGDFIERVFAAGAPMQWQQIGLPVADMMLLESLQFDRTDICNAFHVPVTCLNDMSASTDNNVAAHMKQLIYNAVMPLANVISDRLTRDNCPQYDKGNITHVIQLDCTSLPEMQQDMGGVATWMAQSPWLTYNQKLTGMGFPTSKEPLADKIIIPSNMMLLEDLGNTDQQFTQAGQQQLTM